ncbi:hypothetical protein [Emticicia sp. 21SJ11W-3]|uniref:hypothetical protein n=1 Tax=Emticicia sp. 21SJ11W-3 TaxID=2916755 RepID=UPI0020A0E623|nr:hypothetical protein [Emticicia sp. 21SJ11W-3]UTA67273.1 hypothetical protein MB380_16915 [Emticicia sp. 21SJ11W-3]
MRIPKIIPLRLLIKFIALSIMLILSGCAELVYKPVKNEGKDKDTSNGFRYYNSSPYLLVHSNGKGGLITQIVYLPDPFKKMDVKPKSFLANFQITMEFENGIFQTSKSTFDATVVPSAIIKAIETAAPAFLAGLNSPTNDTRVVPAPSIYKIIVNGFNITFIGDKGDKTINVNILKQKALETK